MHTDERPDEPAWNSIPIAAIEHYAYCARQAALIHLERYFADNAATARGQWAHDTVDQTGPSTTPDGTRRWNSLPVWDSSLGIHGICDVVEFHPEGPFPIEHKSGSYRPGGPADLQVAAQVLCLRSMFSAPVPHGVVFAGTHRRRYEVPVDATLETHLRETIANLRALLQSTTLPPARNDARCPPCSLHEGCMPEAPTHPPVSLFTPEFLDDQDD